MGNHRLPKMRRQRESGRSDRAFVVVQGKRHKLGVWGSEAAERRYLELVSPAVEPKLVAPAVCQARETINELMVDFMRCVLEWFKDNPSEVWHYRTALRILKDAFGELPADDFGPRRLREVRDIMVAKGWGRNYVNSEVNRVRRLFRWAVAEERVDPGVYQALAALEGLKKGRTLAPESPGVSVVDDAIVDATLPFMTLVAADMVRVQRRCGCRPGELCQMARSHLDMSAGAWLFYPPQHKGANRGKGRVIPIGHRAQEVLQKYVFSPGDFFKYDTAGFRQVVRRACDRAFPAPEHATEKQQLEWIKSHRWTPLQLRHSYLTEVRAQFGIEGAQHAGGHSRADVTQVYAEKSLALATEIALKLG